MACTVTWGCQLSVLLLNSYMEAMCCSSLTLLHVCRSYLPVQWFAQSKPNSCLDICLHIVHTISTEPMTAWSIDLYTLYGTVPCLWGFRSVPLLDTQEVCVFLAGEHYYQEAWLFGICCIQIPHWLKCWSICLLKPFGGLVNHLKAQSSVVSRNFHELCKNCNIYIEWVYVHYKCKLLLNSELQDIHVNFPLTANLSNWIKMRNVER